MPSLRRIAVVGAGISGLSAAALLREAGYDVTVFEQFGEAKPLGSGLVLQQTGLAVLANLELDRAAIEMGSRLMEFEGKTVDGRTIFDLTHAASHPGRFSLGVHRHAIFSLLYGKVVSLGIPVVTGFGASEVRIEGGAASLYAKGERHAGFELVVDASGTHSALRDRHADVLHRRAFPHGALWGVCEMPREWPRHVLRQRFQRSNVSVGVIPIGRTPGGGTTEHVGFHWSIRNSEYHEWRSQPIAEWRWRVARLWPETEALVSQIREHDQLAWAMYSDIALRRYYSDRVVFIGDAAHSISPRLGQGANLGLVDALVLSRCMTGNTDLHAALVRYDAERRSHARFYHSASKWLSLLFQSDSVVAPALRDIAFFPLSRIPHFRRQMLDSLSGVKTGLFQTLKPESLHPDYR